jgi:L-aspartate oxidase
MFPTASQYLHQSSIIPSKDLIPIIPAAHYHMGGIQVDINGKTSVEGLWACGECSSTGAHGANRLASNSLLEAFVFSKRIADTINSEPPKKSHNLINIENYIPKEKTISKIRAKKYIWQLRSAMNKFVGVDRNKFTLDQAFIEFFRIERETSKLSAKLKDMLLVSKLITFAAIKREESRGTHFRSDYPFQNKKLLNRNILNQKDLSDYLNNKFKEAV